MARTAAFSFGVGLLFAWNWSRLEEPSAGVGPMLLMIVLGIVPALLPTFRWRIAGVSVAFLLAGAAALDVARPWSIGTIAARAGRGFLDFYDVLVPFDGAAHPLMHGVIQLAVFVFTALAALAIAARRPVLAGLVVVAGAGWPATIMPGDDDLGRGAFVLAAVLALVAWLRPEGRRAPPQILVGFGLIVVALIVSSSGAVAKSQFIGWENWDFYNKPGKPVEVGYVWRSNYAGIDFPKERTRVFTVKAPARSTYWRATTLDVFENDHWDEDQYPLYTDQSESPVTLTGDPLLPALARDSSGWARADVTIDALRDVHLVAPSQPVRYDASDIDDVQYQLGGTAVASRPPRRGTEYTVWGYTPEPRPANLARSSATYPPEITDEDGFLSLPQGIVPPFGSPDHPGWAARYFRETDDGRRYRPLYELATQVAGNARNPYTAAVALEAWFRSAGGFVYDEHPPPAGASAPLVQFVTRTRRGYCQHFAGAMALMLRYLGIPARVAAGFTSGAYDKEREQWAVYDRDAHTWVEVWFRGYGWLPFDPTPNRGTLAGPYSASSTRFDVGGAQTVLQASLGTASLLNRFQSGGLGREGLTPNTPAGESGPGGAQSGGDGRSSVAGLVVLAVLVGALLFVLIKLGLRRSRYLTEDPRRTAAACRSELVEYLRDQRIEVPASIGTRELGELLGSRIGINGTGFADALGRARYGPLSRAGEAAKDARRELKAILRGLRRAIPAGRRFRGLFSLRSLLAD